VELKGKRVLVVGLGKSGVAAVRVLCAHGAHVIANDQRDADQLGDVVGELRGYGAELALGHHDHALFASVDQIVVSPGVPPLAALDHAEAQGVPIASEIDRNTPISVSEDILVWFFEKLSRNPNRMQKLNIET